MNAKIEDLKRSIFHACADASAQLFVARSAEREAQKYWVVKSNLQKAIRDLSTLSHKLESNIVMMGSISKVIENLSNAREEILQETAYLKRSKGRSKIHLAVSLEVLKAIYVTEINGWDTSWLKEYLSKSGELIERLRDEYPSNLKIELVTLSISNVSGKQWFYQLKDTLETSCFFRPTKKGELSVKEARLKYFEMCKRYDANFQVSEKIGKKRIKTVRT